MERAISDISHMERKTVFVKRERIMRAGTRRFDLSPNQARLYAWMRRVFPNRFVKIEYTAGMNFMTYGLLKAKGRIADVRNEHGEVIGVEWR